LGYGLKTKKAAAPTGETTADEKVMLKKLATTMTVVMLGFGQRVLPHSFAWAAASHRGGFFVGVCHAKLRDDGHGSKSDQLRIPSGVLSAMVIQALFSFRYAPGVVAMAILGLCSGASHAEDAKAAKPGTAGNGNIVIGPEYQLDPELTDKGNPQGKSFEFSMPLAASKIFRGDDKTLDPKKAVRRERKIFVYIPAAYQDGTKAPILVTLDGPSQLKLVRHALDNLTISKNPERKLPPFIVIAVENGGNDGKGSERGLEYDTMSDRFARFINDEVLPAVLGNKEIKAAYPQIAFTADPWGKAVMGCSSGGAAALTMGWFRPDLFRRLITYSGTFVDQQDDDAPEEKQYPLGAWEYHSSMKLIEQSEKKPLRIFTHVSENDNRAKDPESTYHNWVMANERTAAALKAKGYDYRFVFSKATKHCDGKVFEATLADTLVWMWRGYETK